MHTSICDYVSRLFYKSALETHGSVMVRNAVLHRLSHHAAPCVEGIKWVKV